MCVQRFWTHCVPDMLFRSCIEALQRHLQSGITKGAYGKFTGQLHQASLRELAYGQHRNSDHHNTALTHTHSSSQAGSRPHQPLSFEPQKKKCFIGENYITANAAKAKDHFLSFSLSLIDLSCHDICIHSGIQKSNITNINKTMNCTIL